MKAIDGAATRNETPSGPRDELARAGSAAWPDHEHQAPLFLRARRPTAIRVSRRYGAQSERVFDAWLDPEVAGTWLFATASRPMANVEIDARVAGWFRFVDRRDHEIVEHIGEYIEIVPHRRLVFTLSVEKHPHVITRVIVEIAAIEAGCELTLTQVNVPPSNADYLESRWTGILYGLEEALVRCEAQ